MSRYRLRPGTSMVSADMRSNVHPIHAETTELRGVIEGQVGPNGEPDLSAPHEARLELPSDSLRTGNQLEDREMARRMDTRRHPNIQVVVGGVRRVDAAPDRCRGRVQVTALGRTRTVEGEFVLRTRDGQVRVEGEHLFDMRDFGISPPRVLMFRMDPEVRVRVRIVAEAEA